MIHFGKHKMERNDPCWCGSGKKYKFCHSDFDQKLFRFELQGYEIPGHELIKTPKDVEGIRKSAVINVAVLDEIGGKGLFVKELDQALRDKRTDLSVHSLKDMPVEIPEDLPVIGFSEREDPRDVLVLPEGISDPSQMDLTKPIGTSSRRRMLQAQELFPQARFESVRGNVLTRLRKLDEGQYSALILAAAGLRRLGLEKRISRIFSEEEIIPSAGQGILALQGRRGEDYTCLDGFFSPKSAIAAAAERGFVCALGGGCTSPIAAHAAFAGFFGPMILRGFYYDEDTFRIYRKKITVQADSPEEGLAAGRELAAAVLAEAGVSNRQL